ncbi:hypothetical protein [Paenibacillus alkalitolerans]|uniref:hypothetical protein n=1 Tax=Paenibacillus alkalitolerans TaxID=2799335 RepID=UPI0018F6699B|nr:hypothetical protein [Paenibacillus alkalitolerans]
MSLKSIEMQIAVPRTNEASNVQNQFHQKPMHDQSALAEHAVKRAEAERQRSGEVEESAFLNVKGDGFKGGGGQPGSGKRNKQPPKNKAVPQAHPYKGKHIDISL